MSNRSNLFQFQCHFLYRCYCQYQNRFQYHCQCQYLFRQCLTHCHLCRY